MNRTRILVAGLLASALGVLGIALAPRRPPLVDAGPLVARAERAVREVPRTGRMRTRAWQEDRLVTSEVDVAYAPGGKHRFEYRTAPLKGVLCIASPPRMWRYDPQRRLIEESVMAADPPADPALLLANYTARWLGTGRVAGRRTDRVELARRRGGGIARRLWLDQETGLPLRTEEHDARGRLVGSTEYLSIRIGAVPDERFRKPAMKGVQWAAPRPKALCCSPAGGDSPASPPPRLLPAGYRLRGTGTLACFCGCGHDLLHTEYTDGLESISLFECGHPSDSMRAAAVSSFARENVATRVHRGRMFVAVGRVAPEELRRMLQSIP